ncbi:MAG: hypothetical protein AAGG99_01510 [Pseudomonadota bacterium]
MVQTPATTTRTRAIARIITSAFCVIALTSFAQIAQAQTIFTGGKTGAYHGHFCPSLQAAMERRSIGMTCEPSRGTADNMQRIADDPANFGYAQLDVFALKADSFGGSQVLSRVRTDDVRECVFAVTKERDLVNFGEIAVFASQLSFFLPPRTSGSTNTFRYLQQIDAEGLGEAQDVTTVGSTDEAIRKALSTDGGVALFVQFPDPNNTRFRLIQELGGHIVPVIDRAILNQEVDGQRVYYAQETQVTNAKWLKAGRTVITACTPMVLFAGTPDQIEDASARRRHEDRITILRGLRAQELLPREPIMARILKRTKQLSAVSAERLSTLSDAARERARPLLQQARETGQELYRNAREGAEIMIEKAKPDGARTGTPAASDTQ